MSDTSEKKINSVCADFKECLEILYLMLDNEASDDQEHYLNNHIEGCMVCFEQYKVEKQIRDLLRAKLAKQKVPSDLAQAIRNKVFVQPI